MTQNRCIKFWLGKHSLDKGQGRGCGCGAFCSLGADKMDGFPIVSIIVGTMGVAVATGAGDGVGVANRRDSSLVLAPNCKFRVVATSGDGAGRCGSVRTA
jgi:hypothetical protein